MKFKIYRSVDLWCPFKQFVKSHLKQTIGENDNYVPEVKYKANIIISELCKFHINTFYT